MAGPLVLVIDAGNSQLVLGVFSRDGGKGALSPRPLKCWRLSTSLAGAVVGAAAVGTPDELRLRVWSLLGLDGLTATDLEAIVIASVVPNFTACAREAFPKAYFIDHTWPFSFRIGTEIPAQTGIDRLVNAEAVVQEYGAPALVVDAGTATTLCALSAPANHERPTFLGGAILPGLKGCRDSLAGRAAQLFLVELLAPPSVIGAHTEHALRSGLIFGYSSMLDGMIQRFKKERPEFALGPVVATGGMISVFSEYCQEFTQIDPELTLKGMRYLYESVRGRSS